MSNKKILPEETAVEVVNFYKRFMHSYSCLCHVLFYDYENECGYYNEAYSQAEKHRNCIEILSEIIYLLWKNLHILDKFPKDEFYMVVNCVRLARSENVEEATDLSINAMDSIPNTYDLIRDAKYLIQDAKELSIDEKYKELEEIHDKFVFFV